MSIQGAYENGLNDESFKKMCTSEKIMFLKERNSSSQIFLPKIHNESEMEGPQSSSTNLIGPFSAMRRLKEYKAMEGSI
jgi:hypothetical protein